MNLFLIYNFSESLYPSNSLFSFLEYSFPTLQKVSDTFLWYMSGRDHRRAELVWDLWRSSGLIPLPKQGHLQLIAKDCVLVTFEYLQGQRFLSEKSVSVHSRPHSENVFLGAGEHPVFQFVPIISSPVTGCGWEEPGFILHAPSFQVFVHTGRFPLLLPFLPSEWSQLSQPSCIGEMLCNWVSPAYTGAWHCFSPEAGFCTSPC